MISKRLLWLMALAGWLLGGSRLLAETDLPVGRATLPVAAAHFPTTAHAVIWRNWFLVSPAKLAAVLGAGKEEIQDMASAMGLPREPRIDPGWSRQGYITIVRRNWHLLPYAQLLPLIGMDAEEFAFALREVWIFRSSARVMKSGSKSCAKSWPAPGDMEFWFASISTSRAPCRPPSSRSGAKWPGLGRTATTPFLTKNTWLLSVSEWNAPFERGGLMLSWSLGGHPSPNLRIAKH